MTAYMYCTGMNTSCSTNSEILRNWRAAGEWIVLSKLFSPSSATLFGTPSLYHGRTNGVIEWTTGASGDARPRSAVMVA